MMRTLLGAVFLGSTLACTGTVDGTGTSAPPPSGTAGSGGSAGGAGSGGTTSVGGSGGSAGEGTGGSTGGVAGTGGSGAGTGASAGQAGTPGVTCGDGLTNRRVRRLSWREYANVAGSLLGEAARAEALATLPAEPRLAGFDNQDSALRVNGSLAETLADLAASLASKADVAVLAPCAEPNEAAPCLDAFARSFATKAYGRPPSTDELARTMAVAALGEDYATSVRLVVELVLQSPNFVYVSELGAPDAPATPAQPVPLTSHEVASQLSFLLTGKRPDQALLDAAAAGGLTTADAVRSEALRLLATAEGAKSLERFVFGWLDMAPIAEAPKSPDFFPDLTPEIVSAMQEELDTFVTTQVAGGNGTLAGLLTAPSTRVPDALLPIYGADYAPGTGFDPTRRGGVLSLPGLLSYHAARDHSGPVERGLFVRRQLLCMVVASPPPEALTRIAENPIEPGDTSLTTRQKFEAHVTDPACKGCHLQFDPIGYGLEQLDGIGRYRTTENQLPVDSRGELLETDIDGPFEGVVELSEKLLQSKMFERCMVDHYFRFALSRPPEQNDACVVDTWSSAFSRGGGTLRELVTASVTHATFTTRKDDR
jgi:hypothetical protein